MASQSLSNKLTVDSESTQSQTHTESTTITEEMGGPFSQVMDMGMGLMKGAIEETMTPIMGDKATAYLTKAAELTAGITMEAGMAAASVAADLATGQLEGALKGPEGPKEVKISGEIKTTTEEVQTSGHRRQLLGSGEKSQTTEDSTT